MWKKAALGSADEEQNGKDAKEQKVAQGVTVWFPPPPQPGGRISQEQPEGPVPAPKLKTKVRLVPILFSKPERSGPREPCQARQHCQLPSPAPTSAPAVSHCSSWTRLLTGSTGMATAGGVPKVCVWRILHPSSGSCSCSLHCVRRGKGRKMWSCWSRSREGYKDAPKAEAALLWRQLGVRAGRIQPGEQKVTGRP